MRSQRLRRLFVPGLAAVAAALAAAAGAHTSAGTATPGRGGRVAPAPVPDITRSTFASATVPTTAYCEQRWHIACYDPAQFQRAYDLAPLYAHGYDGRGRTIVLVDSFGSPTIGHDLAVFDQTFHLPPPPHFVVIQPAGPVPPYNPKNTTMVGWAAETTLDVEYSHAIAPGANLLLVETPVAETEGTVGFPQIVQAENYVIDHHLGDVISQSFDATEQTFPSARSVLALRSAYINAYNHHVSVLTASGDSGPANSRFNGVTYYLFRTVSWPNSDPLNTAVGGIQLHLNASGQETSPASVWNDTYDVPTNEYVFRNEGPNPIASGGGRSVIFGRPAYQNSVAAVVGSTRGQPDISMSAACNGQAIYYTSFGGSPTGFSLVCGTSEASPEFAGIVAIADQYAGHDLGLLNPALYRMESEKAPGIVPVTQGYTTVSFFQGGRLHTVDGFYGSRGYNMAVGVGTVDAARFVPELVTAAG